jgi:hypothetical protein
VIHPLEAYLYENKGGPLTDEQAKDSIAGLVNDPDLLRDVCALFSVELNGDSRCYAMGKVYDSDTRRFGCVTVLSEDVAGVVGNEFLQKAQEDMNYVLMCSYIEYSRFCEEVSANYDTWDDYLDFTVQRGFPPLFKNGVRARLIRPGPAARSALPTLVFIIYLNYSML